MNDHAPKEKPNGHVRKEKLPLSDGTAGAVRVTRIPSDDPGAVVLQFESWESDADDAPECPPLRVTIPVGLLAEGEIDVDGVLQTTREKVRKQVENTKRSRDRLAAIPDGVPTAAVAHPALAAPQPPPPVPPAAGNTAPLPAGVRAAAGEPRP